MPNEAEALMVVERVEVEAPQMEEVSVRIFCVLRSQTANILLQLTLYNCFQCQRDGSLLTAFECKVIIVFAGARRAS